MSRIQLCEPKTDQFFKDFSDFSNVHLHDSSPIKAFIKSDGVTDFLSLKLAIKAKFDRDFADGKIALLEHDPQNNRYVSIFSDFHIAWESDPDGNHYIWYLSAHFNY
jgi:hypothetical protein